MQDLSSAFIPTGIHTGLLRASTYSLKIMYQHNSWLYQSYMLVIQHLYYVPSIHGRSYCLGCSYDVLFLYRNCSECTALTDCSYCPCAQVEGHIIYRSAAMYVISVIFDHLGSIVFRSVSPQRANETVRTWNEWQRRHEKISCLNSDCKSELCTLRYRKLEPVATVLFSKKLSIISSTTVLYTIWACCGIRLFWAYCTGCGSVMSHTHVLIYVFV